MLHRILIVDDNRMSSLSLVQCLQCPDWEFVTAQSGDDALAKCIENPDFSAILMDVQLPRSDGFEFTRLLKEDSQMKNVPVIFISAFGDDRHFQDQAYGAGAVAVLNKPVHVVGLEAKIAAFCELHELRRLVRQH